MSSITQRRLKNRCHTAQPSLTTLAMKLLDPNTLQKSAFAFPWAVFGAGLTLTVNESACYGACYGADSELSKPIALGQASVEVLLRFYKKSSHPEAQAQSLLLGKSIDGKLSELKEKLRLHNEGKPSAAIDILMTHIGRKQRDDVRARSENLLASQNVVCDNGRGFDPALIALNTHGLLGMRFRVEAEQGQWRVQASPGEGTTIEARLPAQTSFA